jgi:dihydrodipicolinate synthase/N-acetylneuraminate lyase
MFTTLVHFYCSKTDRIHPVVIAGTNGEAVTLSSSEKAQLVKTTRELAIELGRPDLTVILGCGGGSTQQVIAEARLANGSGADFALVLVPSYFHFAMTEDAIITFFEKVRIPLSSSGSEF